jgi:large subunit ribosomal protein L5
MAEKDKEEKKKAKPPEAAAKAAAAAAAKAKKAAAKQAAAEEVETDDAPKQPAPPARLYERYRKELIPALQKSLGLDNVHAVPKLEKIVISMGLGRFATEGGEGKAKFNQAEKELQVIAGQKPVRCKAKKSVANFKVREGMDTGVKVTLRGTRMYEFLDRMITLAFPRVKDFRGIDPNGFDKSGNYNFGFTEQTVFPEVDGAAVTFQQGMNITMVTKAVKPEHGRELLKQFGMPFREPGKQNQ